jgi:DNA-binding transcriptional LysR family regulator
MNDIQLRRLDPVLLLAFRETFRSGRLAAAADRLSLTPSALSHALRRMRDVFGDDLFVRRPGGVEPTARARELAPHIDAALDALDALLRRPAPFDPSTTDRVFRLSALDAATSLFLPDLLGGFTRQAPTATLAVLALPRGPALQAVADRKIDLAIGFFWGRTPGLVRTPLLTETYAVVRRSDLPLPRDVETYVSLRHLLVSQDGEPHGVADTALERLGLSRRVAATAPNFFAGLAAASRTELCLTLPARFAARWAASFGLGVRPAPLELRSFSLSAAWRQIDAGDGGLMWLIALLKAQAAAHGPA